MAEQVGTLLWELRTAHGLSLGHVAQQAGISKSAISQWETGKRLPRVTELDAVLDALNANAAQRALVLACIKAPRAHRTLRRLEETQQMPAPPNLGDMLRAMRMRKGWTQEQTAAQLGVGRSTLTLWERGERIPTMEKIHALCYLLGAHEAELVALTRETFDDTPMQMTEWEAAEAELAVRLYQTSGGRTDGLDELTYFSLEREAWGWAVQHEPARNLLARIYAVHAQFYRTFERWTEIGPMVERALTTLTSPVANESIRSWATILKATTVARAGARPYPERGLRLLKSYLPQSTLPIYSAWIISDMAKYLVEAGHAEESVKLAEEATRLSERECNSTEVFMRKLDQGLVLLQACRPREAYHILSEAGTSYSPDHNATLLLRCAEAMQQSGSPSEAHTLLSRAINLIAQHGLSRLQPQADTLAARL